MAWASRRLFWILLLVLACGAVYGRALGYRFVSYDDDIYVFGNRMVLQGISWAGVRWAFEGQHIGHYHPLTWLSHQLDVSLFGLDGRGHHATSLLLHAACTLLVFQFFQRATGQIGRSGAVALLFAVHPLHVEPVAWIASRKDVLSTLFWMGTLVAYQSYCRAPTVLRYLGVVVLYAAGLLSKPMVVTLPVILLLLDYWPLRRVSAPDGEPGVSDPAMGAYGAPSRRAWALLVAEKIPLLVLAALSSWVTMAAAAKAGVMQAQNLSLIARVQNSLVSYVLYLRELILPVDLSIHHERFRAAPSAGPLWAAVAVLAGISAIVFRGRRSHPYLVTGWLFYLVSFLPVIGLMQYAGHSIADRYAYVPSIGAFVMAVWGSAALFRRLPNGGLLGRAAAVAATAVFGFLSIFQVGYWQSSEVLFQHALEVEPDNPRILNLLGVALARRGALDEAALHYSRTIELSPSYAPPLNNLGVLLYQRGRISEAIVVYRRLLRVEPDNPQGHANLALALASQGHAVEAEMHYRTAIRNDPDYLAARRLLARLLVSVGRTRDAQSELEAAIALYPNRSDIRNALAEIAQPSKGTTKP
jgi:protein O-mannosyl-transferase